jgi:hypothetical protein
MKDICIESCVSLLNKYAQIYQYMQIESTITSYLREYSIPGQVTSNMQFITNFYTHFRERNPFTQTNCTDFVTNLENIIP